MLFNGSDLGTKEDFESTFRTEKPLGYFIRSIVGLDRTAAKEAFSAFFHQGNLTGDQITFLNQIIDYLTYNGVMTPGVLFDPPFTDIHSYGLNGVFDQEDSDEITEIILTINKNAEAA